MFPLSDTYGKASTVLKSVLLLQLLLVSIEAQRECLSNDLVKIKYDCNIKIDILNTNITCQGSSSPEKYGQSELYIFLVAFRTNSSVIAMNEHFVDWLKTSMNGIDYLPSSNFYTCGSGREEIPLEYMLESQYCYSNYDCLAVLPKVLENTFITSIKIMDQDLVRFGNLALMINLREMKITKNKKLAFEERVFNDTSSIVNLFLVENNLTTLPLYILEANVHLKILDLFNNLISGIDANAFKDLHSLSSLNLSNNHIEILRNDTFRNLPNLKDLNLSSNKIRTIPSEVFKSNSLLVSIDLSKNDITYVPENLLWDLENLSILKLSNCKLKNVSNTFFGRSINMQHVDLSHNEIRMLPNRVFSDMRNLLHLDLSYNHLIWIPDNTLSNLFRLDVLYLANNEIKSLPEKLFLDTRYLRTLNMSNNELKLLTDADVNHFESLWTLNFSNNQIEYIELGLYEKVYVRFADFSRNNIKTFKFQWKNMVDLEVIDFSFNNITELFLPPCLQSMKTSITFRFLNNNISRVHVPQELKIDKNDHVQISKCFINGGPKNNIYMSNNPFNCDCKIQEFQLYLSKSIRKYEKSNYFPDKENLKCAYPTDLNGKEFLKLKGDSFICPIDAECPKPCRCGKRGSDNRILLNCSSTNIDITNSSVPANTTVLYFQNNNLKSLKDVRVPYWNKLLELRVDNNLLESIEAHDLPESLEFLSVTNNRLKTISPSFEKFMTSTEVFALFAGNNTWNCNCELKTLKNLLETHPNIVRDSVDITCQVKRKGKGVILPLRRVSEGDLCLEKTAQSNGHLMISVVTVSLLVIFLLTAALIYYKNQNTVHAYIYIHCGCLFRCFFGNKELDENKEFDAFVAYSSKDQELVMDILDELEHKEPFFKLCIHDRDWTPGNYISENIVYSVQNSRRTIIMLSEDFISSIWFVVEVRAALFQMLQDKINRLIIIVVGTFPSLDMVDDDIQQLLLRKTYLEWNERWFWEKLRYAMPRHLNSRTETYHMKRKREEKLVRLVDKEITLALTPVLNETDSNPETVNL